MFSSVIDSKYSLAYLYYIDTTRLTGITILTDNSILTNCLLTADENIKHDVSINKL